MWAKSTVKGQRVPLALKAALAVGIAWFLAPHMPGVTEKYPYYAPLGASVSMYPTFMGSVRTSFQTLLGVLLGIAVAAGVLLLGDPNIITISLDVRLGVLLSSSPRLGPGREYVPVATLMVLIIDGQTGVDAFSLGYAAQMGIGVLVRLTVSVTIFPTLKLEDARAGLSLGRRVLIDQLEDVAAALVEQWPPERDAWAARGHISENSVGEIRAAVSEAKESHRANPRGLLKSRHLVVSEGFDDFAVWEIVTFHVRDLSEVLVAAIWAGSLDLPLDVELRDPLSGWLRRLRRPVAGSRRGGGAGSAAYSRCSPAPVGARSTQRTRSMKLGWLGLCGLVAELTEETCSGGGVNGQIERFGMQRSSLHPKPSWSSFPDRCRGLSATTGKRRPRLLKRSR